MNMANLYYKIMIYVITTDSTIEACAKEILKCRGVRISIYAFGAAN